MQSRNVSETADLIIKQFSSILIPFSCFIKKLGEEYLGVEGFSDLLYRNRNIELLIDYKLKKGSYPPIPLCCKLYRLIYGSGMNPFQPDFPIKHPEYCLKTFLEFSVEVLNRKYTVDQLRKYEDVKINNSIHVKQSTRNKRQVSESSSGKSTDGYHTAGQHRSNQLAIHNSKYTQKLQKKSNSAKESCDGYTTKDLITDDDEMSRAHNTTENVSYDALDLLQRGEKKISSYEISESQSHNPTSMVDTKSDSMKMYIPDNISFATIEGIRKKSSLVVVNKTVSNCIGLYLVRCQSVKNLW